MRILALALESTMELDSSIRDSNEKKVGENGVSSSIRKKRKLIGDM